MAVYFANTEITGIKDLFPLSSKDITGLYFADTELFTVWDEYDGILPAQYSANGDMLADYRIYGANGGVGDRTENLWDRGIPEYNYAKDYKKYNPDNAIVLEAGTYTISSDGKLPIIQAFDANYEQYKAGDAITHTAEYAKTWDDMALMPKTGFIRAATIMLSFDCILTFSVLNSQGTYLMLVEGSTAPAEYVPYGYEVDMSVSGGTTSTTTHIYIGDTPLGEDEYVDYGEQKVYRRTENLLNVDRIERRTFTTNTQYYLYGANADSKTLQIDKIVSASITKNYVEVYSLTGVGIGYVVDVKPNTTYTISYNLNISVPENKSSAAINTISNNNVLGTFVAIYGNANKHTITTLNNTKYLFIVFRVVNVNAIYTDIVLTEGSTAPSTYIPYYNPQDPPVLLPALPTVDGTTITDYAGQSAAVPSRFVAKYRKEGFN